MNIQADPVGYKALSRHFAAASRNEAEIADEVRDQSIYIRMTSYALAVLAAIALFTVLHETRAIAMPVVLGVIVGLIFGPLGDRFTRFGIPAPATILLFVLGSLGIFGFVIYLVSPSVGDFAQAIPRISRGFDKVVKSFEQLFAVFETFKKTANDGAALVTETKTSTVDMAKTVAAILTPAVSQFIIFLFTLLLFSASRTEVRNGLVKLFAERDRRLSALRSFGMAESKLTEYLMAVTAVNTGLGAVVAGAFFLSGVPGAFIWGVFAFIFNFLPVVGPLLLKGLLLVFGIAVYPSLPMALLPLGLFMLISLVEANVITPRIVGNKITMSPLWVFLSVVFWTWLWGFAGAFLAMPILAIISVLRNEFLVEAAPKLPG